MSLKRSFNLTEAVLTERVKEYLSEANFSSGYNPASNYASQLPEVYTGSPNRTERYNQYEQMDIDDQCSAALDILAEFCTQLDSKTNLPFEVKYNESPSDTESEIIGKMLRAWCSTNKFETRLFDIIRDVLKLGDAFFVRDPQTYELLWVYQGNVEKVIVNESKGKKPEQYIIRDLDLNMQGLSVSQLPSTYSGMLPSVPGQTFNTTNYNTRIGQQGTSKSRFNTSVSSTAVNAEHIVHLNMNHGQDSNWPFGSSILERVFKSYKQKELIEDSIIIYRIQRAPMRRVFNVDVGDLSEQKAMQFIEQIKNSINQRRIPSKTGGNANILDASYNPICLALDTKIPLLDNRVLELKDLITEYQNGKENWVYSCHPVSGEIVPGNITWAGITQQSAKVLKLTLDNGKTITCTPEHKFPVLGKGFVEAKNLSSEDSLISFETKQEHLSGKLHNKGYTYTKVYDHSKNNWEFVHSIVGHFFRKIDKHQQFTFLPENIGKVKTVIHHKDFNRYNNDPRNLQFMEKKDHILWHAYNKKEYWERMSDEEYERMGKQISNSLKEYYGTFTEEDWKEYSNIHSDAMKKVHKIIKETNPEKYQQWFVNSGIGIENLSKEPTFLNLWSLLNKTEESTDTQRIFCKIAKDKVSYRFVHNLIKASGYPTWKEFLNNILDGKRNNHKLRAKWDQRHLQILVDEVKKCPNLQIVFKNISANQEFKDLLKKLNPDNPRLKFERFGNDQLKSLFNQFGFKNLADFKEKLSVYNHRITNIEYLEEPITVGTITVDGNERWHNYHTFALDAGIFTKNSILDDIYLPKRPDGRGSNVEMLQGGDTAWGIAELLYFNNKLSRGLRIPVSYLPTGPDESTTTYNDGKVGAALIQEYRFAQQCLRIQRSLIGKFDEEFKLYLKKREVNVDSSLFNLRFIEPQSFASYREIELDTSRLNNFNQIVNLPFISKRFAMEHYLGLSMDEINLNNEMLIEENPGKFESVNSVSGSINNEPVVDLRSVGISKADAFPTEEQPDDQEGAEGEGQPGEESVPTGQQPIQGQANPSNPTGQ